MRGLWPQPACPLPLATLSLLAPCRPLRARAWRAAGGGGGRGSRRGGRLHRGGSRGVADVRQAGAAAARAARGAGAAATAAPDLCRGAGSGRWAPGRLGWPGWPAAPHPSTPPPCCSWVLAGVAQQQRGAVTGPWLRSPNPVKRCPMLLPLPNTHPSVLGEANKAGLGTLPLALHPRAPRLHLPPPPSPPRQAWPTSRTASPPASTSRRCGWTLPTCRRRAAWCCTTRSSRRTRRTSGWVGGVGLLLGGPGAWYALAEHLPASQLGKQAVPAPAPLPPGQPAAGKCARPSDPTEFCCA
jgi:hypothetical protein